MSVHRNSIGVGFKPQHRAAAIDSRSALDFIEVHPENYMVDGGPMLRTLEEIRAHYPVSFHGVGLSLAGADPLDRRHLERFAELVGRFKPPLISEHLAWSSFDGKFFNDLLPIPYTLDSLQHVCHRIDEVQEELNTRVLIENPATYVQFRSSSFTEGDFLRELVRRTGCGLLLDVNNAYVAAVNHGYDPHEHIRSMPLTEVGEIHLAGFSRDVDAAGSELLIDSHGTPIDPSVWELYAWVIGQIGLTPTLVERDNNVPDFPEIMLEAARARNIADAVRVATSPLLASVGA